MVRTGANFQKKWAKYFQGIVRMDNHCQPTHVKISHGLPSLGLAEVQTGFEGSS